jgi:3-oxoadipate CoA-transferase alpha subunit
MGNLIYRKTARNFGPVMATAATLTIAEVSTVVDTGQIDPEVVITPSIYVDRVVDRGAASSSLEAS